MYRFIVRTLRLQM